MPSKIFSDKTLTIFLFLLLLLPNTSCTSLNRPISSSKLTDLHIDSEISNPQIELFVMSQCPYAVEAEKAIIPVIKELKGKVDFHLYFIADENSEDDREEIPQKIPGKDSGETEYPGETEEHGTDQCQGEFVSEGGKFKSLHGKSEIEEDIRQVVMAKYYPDKYLDYLFLRSENFSSGNWEECASKAWIDCEFMSRIAQSEMGEMLLRENIKKARELRISASPTLLINGKRYKGQINRFDLGRKICREGAGYEFFCKFIPVCGADSDCLATDKVGVCVDPDKPQAACKFSDPVKFTLTVIKPPDECPVCSPDQLVNVMKDLFPGVEIKNLESTSAEAKGLIHDLKIKELPAFYFDKNVTKTARYDKIKERLLEKGNGFLLDPQYINITYILDREEKKGDVKLFVESMSPKAIATEDYLIKDGLLKKAGIDIHYLAGRVNSQSKKEVEVLTINRDPNSAGVLHLRPQPEKIVFKSPKGLKEIQEDIRQICITKYYPDQHLDYLSCINKNFGKEGGKIDWKQCLSDKSDKKVDYQKLEKKVDYQKVESCANGKEGMNLLLQDVALIEELGISLCPTYLINNKILVKGIDPIGFKRLHSELAQPQK